ncbi:hypothetical protein K788_0004613 [Paraburkholderia caribensis MBA4]|uniref:Uncharacterized protein n=1 Tax=Paraburkholderia caribensis MBA4 TaxID=1323664 RepID=A0A0P0RK68_9BURK|nr:hypothetical protein K788_0004613 [Paraburkholderia caribensis MBA4]
MLRARYRAASSVALVPKPDTRRCTPAIARSGANRTAYLFATRGAIR